MLKKILILIISVFCVFLLACDNQEPKEVDNKPQDKTQEVNKVEGSNLTGEVEDINNSKIEEVNDSKENLGEASNNKDPDPEPDPDSNIEEVDDSKENLGEASNNKDPEPEPEPDPDSNEECVNPAAVILRQDTDYFTLHPAFVGDTIEFDALIYGSKEDKSLDYIVRFANSESIEKIDDKTYKFLDIGNFMYHVILIDKEGFETNIVSKYYNVRVNYPNYLDTNREYGDNAYYIDEENNGFSLRAIVSLSEERYEPEHGFGLVFKNNDKITVTLGELRDGILYEADAKYAYIDKVNFVIVKSSFDRPFTIDENGIIHSQNDNIIYGATIRIEYDTVAIIVENGERIEKVFHQKLTIGK